MTLKDLLEKIEASDILETGWGTEAELTGNELYIWLEHLPRELSGLSGMIGLVVETDYEVFHDDSGVCEGYAVLTDRSGLIVATLDYRLPEYRDDECDGSGNLRAVAASSKDEYDRLLDEQRVRQWKAAFIDSLMAAGGLLRCSPLDPQEAMRELLTQILPRNEAERIRFLNMAVLPAARELQEKDLRHCLKENARGLARIEWVEKSEYDDMGGFYTYLESIDLVATDGERFHLGSDDQPFWLCDQFEAMDEQGVFGDEDPAEAFGAYLCRRFGFEGGFDDLWDLIQNLVSVLRDQGLDSVDLKPAVMEGAHEAA